MLMNLSWSNLYHNQCKFSESKLLYTSEMEYIKNARLLPFLFFLWNIYFAQLRWCINYKNRYWVVIVFFSLLALILVCWTAAGWNYCCLYLLGAIRCTSEQISDKITRMTCIFINYQNVIKVWQWIQRNKIGWKSD